MAIAGLNDRFNRENERYQGAKSANDFLPVAADPSAQVPLGEWIQARYDELDAFDTQSFSDAFAADGTFVIAGFPATVGPAATKAAIDNFFAILEPGGISHNLQDSTRDGRVVHLLAIVTYTVLNDPTPIPINVTTRIEMTLGPDGQKQFQHMHVFFDVSPQVLFDAFAAANP